jgi:LCP family protein required for cell wall assembly
MNHETMTLEAALMLIREAHKKKEYRKVLIMGKSILQSAPQSMEVKEMVKEAEIFVMLRKGRVYKFFSIFATILALCAGSLMIYQWMVINPNTNTVIESQNQKYNGLVKENGQLQQKNNELLQNMQSFHADISMLASGLQSVRDKLSRKRNQDPDEKDNLIMGLQQRIDEQNNQIQKLMNLSVSAEKNKSNIIYGNNIVNILILGENGGLTDTIMIASINPSLKTISLISIPRDLYVEGRKINEIAKEFGRDTLGVYIHDITGLVIHHYVTVQFDGFKKIIDALGGIDINVGKDIEDKNYPVGDGTVETFSIKAGWQHMDGETALKYARTRHDDSDFERAKRQQQVVDTILQKFNALNITDINKLFEMGYIAIGAINTDINIFEGLGYYQDYKNYRLKTGNVISTANYLYSTKSPANAYILLPNDTTFQEIRQFVYDVVMK